jgi:hypothetical protein
MTAFDHLILNISVRLGFEIDRTRIDDGKSGRSRIHGLATGRSMAVTIPAMEIDG